MTPLIAALKEAFYRAGGFTVTIRSLPIHDSLTLLVDGLGASRSGSTYTFSNVETETVVPSELPDSLYLMQKHGGSPVVRDSGGATVSPTVTEYDHYYAIDLSGLTSSASYTISQEQA